MIVRRAPGEATDGQVLAVNVDLALVTEPLPDPNERRLERFAALAASGDVPAALVLTKTDLVEDGYLTPRRWRAGWAWPTPSRSARSPAKASASCAQLLQPGETAVLLGASGTGKSTLINALLGEERQATGEVRADGRGRHTTVTRELLTLPGGAFLIDTPGIRIAGLWDGTGEPSTTSTTSPLSAVSRTAATRPNRAARCESCSTRSGSRRGASSSASSP